MADDRGLVEEHLADLLTLLRPAPPAWVRAAQELPFARAEIDTIVRRAEEDASFRRALHDDLEGTVREAGVRPDPVVMAALREHLRRS